MASIDSESTPVDLAPCTTARPTSSDDCLRTSLQTAAYLQRADMSERNGELLACNDPVDLAAYPRKHGTIPPALPSTSCSTTCTETLPVSLTGAESRHLAPSMAVSSSSYRNAGYPLPSAYWQSVVPAHTSTTCSQTLLADSRLKEARHNPFLLQIQTAAQLQALLHRLPAQTTSSSVSTAQSQSVNAAVTASARRQFTCTMCGKALSSQHNLRLHEATIHHGLFQFHCPICNKGLRQERDLRGHMANRHDCKKEFRCSICGHEFGYKRNLKHHVISHHGRVALD